MLHFHTFSNFSTFFHWEMPVLLIKMLRAKIFVSTDHANVLTAEPTIGMCCLIREALSSHMIAINNIY